MNIRHGTLNADQRAFYLTKVDHQTDPTVNAGTFTFSDVLRACGKALQGYILSTYSLDLRRFAKEFAQFNKVPALILHGDDSCKRVPKTNTFYHATVSSSSTESEPKIVTDWKIEMPNCMEVVYVDCRTKHSGVHHSKFILCFCKNYFRLAISTENMTTSRCSNALWLSPKMPTVPKSASQIGLFQARLNDYLSKVDEMASVCGAVSKFISGMKNNVASYARRKALNDNFVLLDWIDFSEVEAHGPRLVTSVPITQTYKEVASAMPYGYLCVTAHLSRCSRVQKLMTSSDILVLQPTSVGSGVNLQYFFHEIVNSLSCGNMPRTDHECFSPQNVRLVWPDERFIRGCCNGSLLSVFLDPRLFSQMGSDVWDCFVLYKPAHISRAHLPPHTKMYCRLRGDDPSRLVWLFLGSMCLSKGAMGYWRCPEHRINTGCECKLTPTQRVFTVRNFDMGVLFLCGPDSASSLRVGMLEKVRTFDKDGIALPLPFQALAPFYCARQGLEACPWTDRPFFHPPLDTVVAAGCAFPWILSTQVPSPSVTNTIKHLTNSNAVTTTVAMSAAPNESSPEDGALDGSARSSSGCPGKRHRLATATDTTPQKQFRRSVLVGTKRSIPSALSPLRFPAQSHVLLEELNEHLEWVEAGLLMQDKE